MGKKIYYKIGEACKEVDIQPYVLRYWETEFPFLSPDKSKSGQRVYNERELGIIRRIKELLYDEGYTIAGAKKRLESELADGDLESLATEAAPKPKRAAKSRAKRSSKTKTAASKENALDSDAQERIKMLRAGIKEALDQANGILELLGSPTR